MVNWYRPSQRCSIMKSDFLGSSVRVTLEHLSLKFFRRSAFGTFEAGDRKTFRGLGLAYRAGAPTAKSKIEPSNTFFIVRLLAAPANLPPEPLAPFLQVRLARRNPLYNDAF